MNARSIGLSLVFAAVFLFVIKTFDISYPLKVSLSNTSQELAVVGEGKVDAAPDTAFIDVGITVSNVKTVQEAREKIDTINNQLIESVKKLSISPQDIKTTNYSIYPTYTYENNVNKITGYDGNATITVKTKKMESVPLIIEAATQAGANQINNTRFVIDAPEKYRESAREKAIKNAKDQAEKMAKSLGIKLGKIVNVVESTNSRVAPMDGMSYAKMSGGIGGGGGSPALEPGSETVSSVVTLYFEKR